MLAEGNVQIIAPKIWASASFLFEISFPQIVCKKTVLRTLIDRIQFWISYSMVRFNPSIPVDTLMEYWTCIYFNTVIFCWYHVAAVHSRIDIYLCYSMWKVCGIPCRKTKKNIMIWWNHYFQFTYLLIANLLEKKISVLASDNITTTAVRSMRIKWE